MSPDFRFPAEAQLWAPLPVPVPLPMVTAFRNYLPTIVVARVANGVSLDAARVRFDAQRLALVPPPPAGEPAPPQAETSLVPLQRYLVGDRSTTLGVLMASAALVLLVACANAATLLFARALARSREIAVHAALGATRARLARRLLVESVLLAGLGAAFGVAIAAATLPLLEALLPARLAGLAPAALDWRVLAFALAATVATGLAFGIVPALGASRVRLGEALKSGGERGTRSGRIRSALVVMQVALATVLVVSSALMIASLRTLLDADVGLHNLDRVASARLNVPTGRYQINTAFAQLVQSVIERLEQATSGVEAAGAINALPFDQEAGIRMRVDVVGAAPVQGVEAPFAPYRVVSPGYLRAIGLELVRGRDIAWSDRRTEAVAVINRTLAEALWPGEDPLGKRIEYLGGPLHRSSASSPTPASWISRSPASRRFTCRCTKACRAIFRSSCAAARASTQLRCFHYCATLYAPWIRPYLCTPPRRWRPVMGVHRRAAPPQHLAVGHIRCRRARARGDRCLRSAGLLGCSTPPRDRHPRRARRTSRQRGPRSTARIAGACHLRHRARVRRRARGNALSRIAALRRHGARPARVRRGGGVIPRGSCRRGRHPARSAAGVDPLTAIRHE